MTDNPSPAAKSSPAIGRGTCHVIYAFEAANSIDLDAAEKRLAAAQRETIAQKQRVPSYFEYRPAPLRMTRDAPPRQVAGFPTRPAIELVLYDFGAISLSFEIPLRTPLHDLVRLAAALRGNDDLVAEARRQVEQVLATLGDAASRPRLAPLVEDYVVFQVDEMAPAEPAPALFARESGLLAQILRAEARPLSEQEIHIATALQASFGPDDLTIIDTDASLVFDRDAADVLAVIEFANAQILEMRFLDQQLDDVLEGSYALLAKRRFGPSFRLSDPDLHRVAQFQLDAAILFERVTNALKLIGEQYLTRIYTLVSRRFHLADWDASITRKLQAVDNIYQKLADRAGARRLELLEWIIIVLIAVSIVVTLPGLGGK